MFTIQIYYPSAGLFLITNHKSQDLESLKELLNEPIFAGSRYQIVDEDDNLCYGPLTIEPISNEDLAKALGVPVVNLSDFGPDMVDKSKSRMDDVGYTLEAIHEGDGETIISMRLEEAQADKIMQQLWKNVNFWSAPGGSSRQINTVEQAETINNILGNCWIIFSPGRHKWLFHVHLLRGRVALLKPSTVALL